MTRHFLVFGNCDRRQTRIHESYRCLSDKVFPMLLNGCYVNEGACCRIFSRGLSRETVIGLIRRSC